MGDEADAARLNAAEQARVLRAQAEAGGLWFETCLPPGRAEARKLSLNVSQACELGLKAEIARARRAQWLEENREAIASSNEYVERHGIPLAEFRQF